MSKMKLYKGTIDSWYTVGVPKSFNSKYGVNEGYVVHGRSVDHPQFGGGAIRTSIVMSRDGNEIETLNSRYTLGAEYGSDMNEQG